MKTMERTIKVNGVDLVRLKGTIDAVRNDPKLGAFRFRAENAWIQGGHNRSTIKSFYGAGKEDDTRSVAFVMDNDEPDVLLGNDLGANPVEYLLHALAGCMTTSMVYHAAARGMRIEELESSYEGDIDVQGLLGLSETVRKGYQNIRVTFRVKGDLTDAQLEELASLTRFSPVLDTVSNPVPVSIQVQRKGSAPGR